MNPFTGIWLYPDTVAREADTYPETRYLPLVVAAQGFLSSATRLLGAGLRLGAHPAELVRTTPSITAIVISGAISAVVSVYTWRFLSRYLGWICGMLDGQASEDDLLATVGWWQWTMLVANAVNLVAHWVPSLGFLRIPLWLWSLAVLAIMLAKTEGFSITRGALTLISALMLPLLPSLFLTACGMLIPR